MIAIKTCSQCRETKPVSLFGATERGLFGVRGNCKACQVKVAIEWGKRNHERKKGHQRAHYHKHKEKYREQELVQRYGLTLADFEDLLAGQGGQCAICRGNAPGGKGTWHVDHDHETGRVRGLLCHNCNTGLGGLRDDPTLLRAALAYLEEKR